MKSFIHNLQLRCHQVLLYRRLQNYYQRSDKKAVSALSRGIDFFFTRVLLLLISYLWFVYRTLNPGLSILLSLLLTGLAGFAIHLWKRPAMARKRREKRRLAAREHMSQELAQLDAEAFKWLLMKILLKLPNITPIHSGDNYLETNLNGKRTAIGYQHGEPGVDLPPAVISAFLREVRTEGFEQAVYISTGKYEQGCSQLVTTASTCQLYLVDEEGLLNIMEKTHLVPDEETVDKLIHRKISGQSRQRGLLKKEILTPRRIHTYLAYSLFFLVIAWVIKVFSIYYLALSGVFLALALFAHIQHIQAAPEEENILQQIMRNNGEKNSL